MDKDMFKHPDERKALKVHKVGEKNPLYKKMLHASSTGTPLDITDEPLEPLDPLLVQDFLKEQQSAQRCQTVPATEPLADDTSSCSSLINGADN